MIPLHDNIPTRTVPFVNYGIIAACALVFLMQLADQPGQPSLVERYGMIPARVGNPRAEVEIIEQIHPIQTPRGVIYRKLTRPAVPPVIPPILTMLTCIFLHGGWLHLLGNMWFLHIFGDNVEDRFGHGSFLIFYIGCGLAASAVHYISDPASTIPTIGASGAIAGVMGAYFVWYRDAQVQALVPLGPILQIVVLPAPLFLGIWFVLQLISGTFSGQAEGVAWWAHIGGFAAGAVAADIAGRAGVVRPLNRDRRGGPRRVYLRRQP